MPPIPTKEIIEAGDLVEDNHLDFKQKVDLATDRGKAKLIDDVVAFLNKAPGYLVIGVAEERGRFLHFEPLRDDPDAYARQLLSMIQDSIEPRPLDVDVSTFDVDGGFVAIVHIPWHGRRAFQNRLTGAFMMRTGPKNVVLRREEVRALFTPEEDFARDTLAFMEQEDKRCLDRGLMQENGPTLHLAIIPEERYEQGRASFERGHGMLKSGPVFHGGYEVFCGCQDGYEALEIDFEGRSISRIHIADDWSIYVQVVHPFHDDHGRVTINEFERALPIYMGKLARLLANEGLRGPFCVALAARHLKRNPNVAWAFPSTEAILPTPTMISRIDDPDLLARFSGRIYRGSRYGG